MKRYTADNYELREHKHGKYVLANDAHETIANLNSVIQRLRSDRDQWKALAMISDRLHDSRDLQGRLAKKYNLDNELNQSFPAYVVGLTDSLDFDTSNGSAYREILSLIRNKALELSGLESRKGADDEV